VFTHYLDFRYSGNGAVIAGGSPVLAQHVIMAVHRFNMAMAKKSVGGVRAEEDITHPRMRHGGDDRRRRLGADAFLAISLPRFLPKRDGREPWRPGDRLKIMRIFGSEDHLSSFATSEDVTRMIASDLVRPPRIRIVPDGHGRCVFRRERRSEKETLPYVLRSEKRFAERDRQRLAADPNLTPRDSHAILIDRLEKLERSGRLRSRCYISMQSQSGASPFGLSIERTTVVADGEVFFDSYGLASSAASWVPDF
jgi:hypothetical protein